MKLGRRGFLKMAGGLVAATIAAPAFIRAENLEMGVPHARRLFDGSTDAYVIEARRIVDRWLVSPEGQQEIIAKALRLMAWDTRDVPLVLPDEHAYPFMWGQEPPNLGQVNLTTGRPEKQVRLYEMVDDRGHHYTVHLEDGRRYDTHVYADPSQFSLRAHIDRSFGPAPNIVDVRPLCRTSNIARPDHLA